AAAMVGIDDPHVARILDFGNTEGVPWFAMELIDGETLRQNLDRTVVLPDEGAFTIMAHVARGLSACDDAGAVHRDLSPSNIMLSAGGARVVDLGLAYKLGASLTLTRQAGTVLYMSPEQVDGKPLHPRSDLFSLGAVAYECLTGKAAFEGRTLEDTLARI